MSEIFEITHDAGDLSEYDSTVTDGGDLSAAVAAALAGTDYGLSCVIDDTTEIYGKKDFTQLTGNYIRLRFYVDPNGLSIASGNDFGILRLYEATTWRFRIRLGYSSGNYTIEAEVRDDVGTGQPTSAYTITDDEHYIEVLLERATTTSSNDGTLTLYIDGVQKEQLTGLDIYDNVGGNDAPDNALLGAVGGMDASTSGTYYLDEFILRDDNTEIGPAITKNALSGSLTPSGSLAHKTLKALAGSLTPSGSLARKTLKSLSGSLTPSGVLSSILIKTNSVAGSLIPSGSLAHKTLKALAGSLTPSGSATRKTLKSLSGSLTPSGVLSSVLTKINTLAGSLTPSGSLTRKIFKSFSGSLVPSGSLSTTYQQGLGSAQKNITGHIPAVTLDIGGETLDSYVVAYEYEEEAQSRGGLAIWLDNRDESFNDLVTNYPGLTRGAVVELKRGLVLAAGTETVELPRTWVETMQYEEGLLLLSCIDWLEKLASFRYEADQSWSSTSIYTIVASLLSQVGLTLDAGSFGFSISHTIEPKNDGDDALRDLMDKVEEFLYADIDGTIKFKTLDTGEAAGYAFDWSGGPGTGGGTGHPLLPESEVAQSSLEFNKVIVNGSGGATGTAEDTTESGLVGTRARVITDESLTTNAQCEERATGELSFYQARQVAGTLVCRPYFYLRLYDVVSIAAPPWGGDAQSAARVTGYVERYGNGDWEQEITVGDLPEQSLLHSEEKKSKKGRKGSSRKAKRSSRRSSKKRVSRYSYAYRYHTHKANDLEGGSVGTAELADGSVTEVKLATDAVTAGKIAAGAVDTSELASDAVTTSKIAAGAVGQTEIASNAVGNSEMRDNAIDTAELVDGAVTAAKLADGAVLAEILDDDGAGSNLDADLLDGNHAAAFAASGHAHEVDQRSDMFNDAEGNPADVSTASSDGTSTYAARRDHVHKVANGAIGTSQIADGAVTQDKIANGAVGGSEIGTSVVSSTHIATAAVGTTELAGNSVDSEHYKDGSIDTVHIADGAVTCAKLSSALQTLIGC